MKDKQELLQFVSNSPDVWIQDAIYKAEIHINQAQKIACLISGGSDSDIMTDMLYKLDDENKVIYAWVDTGLEFEATKRHLKEIEKKYGIEIIKLKSKMPIPFAVRKHGVPFLSKYVSDMISRLQRHGFQWEDGTFEELIVKYPKCRGGLRWWCNDWGEGSRFNISRNSWLKEFMMENPPDFPISPKCCEYAKKSPANDFVRDGNFDLRCIGIRKQEGGIRGTSYQSCFTPQECGKEAQYRPLFWFDDKSKEIYKQCHNVKYSDCYEIWGLKRTGCAVCPFGQDFEFEMECVKTYEPKFYNAVWKIFGKSYEYTRKYRLFQTEKKSKKTVCTGDQLTIFDIQRG